MHIRYFLKLAILALISASAWGQAVRVDPLPVTATSGNTPPGAYSPVLAIPGSSIKLCTDAACTIRAQTYTGVTASVLCPTTAQVVLAGTSQCTQFADPQGNFGFWLLPGTYWYRITIPNGTIYGSFPFTAGASSFGAGVLTFNSRTGNVVPVSGDYNSLQISGLPFDATFSATPTFDLSAGTIQRLTLSGTVTGAFLANQVDNLWYQFKICQDGTGNHTFQWPGTVHGAMQVGQIANTCSLQVFLAASGQLYALTTGVTNQ